MHSFTDKVIVARREKLLSANNNATDAESDDGGRRKMALLDILLQSTIDGESLTNLDIREEIDTFMFEGSLIAPALGRSLMNFKLFFIA